MEQLADTARWIQASVGTAWLGLVLLRGLVVFSVALGISALLGRAAGRFRYGVMGVAFAGALFLPALTSLLPAWPLSCLPAPVASAFAPLARSVGRAETLEMTRSSSGSGDQGKSVGTTWVKAAGDEVGSFSGNATQSFGPGGAATSSNAVEGALGASRGHVDTSVAPRLQVTSLPGCYGSLFVGIWLIGVLLLLGSIVSSLFASRRMAREAKSLDSESWLALLERAKADLGIDRQIQLLMSAEVHVPMTAGVLRPILVLPPESADWTDERRRVVLAHELMHIKRGDWILQILTRLALALHWPDPMAWVAVKKAESAREQACDDGVVELGTKPSVYAGHLLDIATAASSCKSSPVAVLAMARRSQLEGRLLAILRDRGQTRPLTALWLLYPLAMAMVVLTVAAAVPGDPLRDATASISDGLSTVVATTETTTTTDTPDTMVVVSEPKSSDSSDSDSDTITTRIQTLEHDRSGFTGYTHNEMTTDGDRIIERVGTWNGDLILEKNFSDGMRVSLFAHHADLGTKLQLPDRLEEGAFVELESTVGGRVHSLTMAGGPDGAPVPIWKINGEKQPFDAAAQQWRDAMMALVTDIYNISNLRGQVSSLRGDISSIRGDESSLRGEISSVRGEESSLRGDISSIRGDESSLRGDISSIRGDESSLRGEISSVRGEESSARGEISSLKATADELARERRELDPSIPAEKVRIDGINIKIEAVEKAIRDQQQQIREMDVDGRVQQIEQQIVELNVDARVREIEKQIGELNVDEKVREIQKQIAALDVQGKVEAIRKQIVELDVPGKVRALEAQIEALNAPERLGELDRQLQAHRAGVRDAVEQLQR